MYSEEIAQIADEVVGGAADIARRLLVIADALRPGDPGLPQMTDLRAALPVNPRPDEPWLVANKITDWWERTPAQIDGITIHHVASNGNPQATAAYVTRSITQGGKGYPRTQYHFWINADGEIFYCLDLKYGCWHDNCGHQNRHVSIVLNGALHKNKPTVLQLASAGRLTAWLMDDYQIELSNVEGHREWAQRALGRWITQCPGWADIAWRDQFFEAVNAARVITTRVSFSVGSSLDTEQMLELATMER